MFGEGESVRSNILIMDDDIKVLHEPVTCDAAQNADVKKTIRRNQIGWARAGDDIFPFLRREAGGLERLKADVCRILFKVRHGPLVYA